MGDARVGIDIEAEDDTGQAFDEAGKRIDELGDKAGRASGGLQQFADAAVSGARGVERAMGMMTRLDLVQITLQQSADRVTAAQEGYNRALEEFGEGSAQARASGSQLEAALVAQEKAALRANLSFGLVGVQALQMSVTAIPALRAALVSLTAAQTASAGAAALLNVTLTAGVAAISITAGILAVKAAMDSMASSTDAAAMAVGRFNGAGDDAATQQAIDAAQQRVAAADMEYEHRREVNQLMATGTVESINQEMDARRARRDELVGLLEQDNTAFLAAEQRRLEMDRRFLEEMQAGLERGPAPGVDVDSWAAGIEGVISRTEAKIAGRESLLADAILTPERAQEVHNEIQVLNGDLEAFSAINQRLAAATSSAYRGMGIDISRFSQDVQASLLSAAGVSEEFIATLRPLVTAEQLLALAGGKTREALLEQLDVTNQKGESTEDLARRLGITSDEEARLRDEGRWTTDGIISQKEALQNLQSTASKGAGGAGGAGPAGANASLLPSWAPAPGGSWTPVAGAAQAMGGSINPYTRSIQHGSQFQGSGAAGMALDALDAALKANPGLASDPRFQAAMYQANLLARNMYAGGGAAGGLQRNLGGLGIRFAADGFDGTVRGPTLFMAGEGGRPEHVSVQPGARGGASPRGGLTLNGGIHVDARGATSAAMVTRGVVDAMSIMALRASSARGF